MTTDEELERQGKLLATHYIPGTATVYIYEGCIELANAARGDGPDPTVYVKKFYDDMFDEAKGNAEKVELHLQSGELFALLSLLVPSGTRIPGQAMRALAGGRKRPSLHDNGWERMDGMDVYQKVYRS